MANTKLLKVMDYLINEQTDKATELLHQIFIEKARAIHEEMRMQEDDMDEDMMRGDQGGHLGAQIESDLNEIDVEEHYGTSTMEAEDDDMAEPDAEEDLSDELEDDDMEDMGDMEDPDDMDMGDEEVEGEEDADMTQVDMDMDMDHEGEEDQIHDLEQAIAELKAEFAALKDEVEGGHDDEGHEAHEAGEEHEDEMAEAWATEDKPDLEEEEYDPLAENVDLEAVHAAKGGEVGSGRYTRAETNTRSPVPTTQTDHMGARPVKTGQGPKASGYDRQSAPDSKSMGLSNRRRDADQGKHPVSKEGDSGALLNKGTSAGYGAVNTRSPISGRK